MADEASLLGRARAIAERRKVHVDENFFQRYGEDDIVCALQRLKDDVKSSDKKTILLCHCAPLPCHCDGILKYIAATNDAEVGRVGAMKNGWESDPQFHRCDRKTPLGNGFVPMKDKLNMSSEDREAVCLAHLDLLESLVVSQALSAEFQLPERLKPRVVCQSGNKTRDDVIADLAAELLYDEGDIATREGIDAGFPIVAGSGEATDISSALRAHGAQFGKRECRRAANASGIPAEVKAEIRERLDARGLRHAQNALQTTTRRIEKLEAGLRRDQAKANVTRPATRAEKESTDGVTCRREELQKLVDFGCLGKIYSEDEARRLFPDGTISGVHVLTSIKHAERLKELQKFKGRAVLLGDRIFRLRDGRQIFPNATDAGMFGPVTTLQAARAIVARSLIHDFPLESVDLTSAYLQAKWPEQLPPHFLKLTPDAFSMLPKDLRDAARNVNGAPVFKMERCLYGHPLSGHIWIETFLSFMRERGWRSLPDDPALMQRGNTWLCIYVDDVAATGPPDELAQMWAEMRDRFKVGMQEPLKDFLGLRIQFKKEDDGRSAYVDMSDYSRLCVDTYAELWPESVVRPCDTPMSDELRFAQDEKPDAQTPQKRVQKVLGMLLWLARCGRPDIALSVSRLGSRAARWDDVCDKQLLRLMGYLQTHHASAIRMFVSDRDNINDLRAVVSSDANLPPSGKAQTGYVLAMEGDGGTLVPIAWASKGQPLTADSTLMSELIAAHTAVRETLCLASALQNDVVDIGTNIDDSKICKPIILRVDNEGVLSNCRRGVSDACGVMAKALSLRVGLLRDLREMGLFDVVYVKTDENRSDMYTKALTNLKLIVALEANGVVPMNPKKCANTIRAHRCTIRTLRGCRNRSIRRATLDSVSTLHAEGETNRM
ncbi:MAG: reverse transcriptase domain-containing protein [Vicinamibacterales bacterium]|nr:reverse transcriptase domain-containing protein [Vicinamibacterales bacterium]